MSPADDAYARAKAARLAKLRASLPPTLSRLPVVLYTRQPYPPSRQEAADRDIAWNIRSMDDLVADAIKRSGRR